MTITESTFGSCRTRSTTLAYVSGGAEAIMSIGLPTLASAGRMARTFAVVSGASATISSPFASHASAARIPGPPALVTMATREPWGNG